MSDKTERGARMGEGSTMTTVELAHEVSLTPKTIRLAIDRRELRATRQGRGREQNVYVIQREDADAWIRWRSERKKKSEQRRSMCTYVPIRERRPFQDPRDGQSAYFPNHDDETMDDGKMEKLKREALQGDARAKAWVCLPWEQGGLGVTVWLRAGIGAEA